MAPLIDKMREMADGVMEKVGIKPPKTPEQQDEKEFQRDVVKWLREAKLYHSELYKRQRWTELYYAGDQTHRDRIPAYMCNAVDNVIFRNTETLVPMITAQLPEFVAIPAEENEQAAQIAEDVQRILSDVFTTENVQKKMEMSSRQMVMRIYGALKVVWDKTTLKPRIISIDNKNLYFCRHGQTVDEMPYLFEYHRFTADEWEREFGTGVETKDAIAAKNAGPVPDLEEQIVTNYGYTDGTPDMNKERYNVYEMWTNEWHCWLQTNGSIFKKEPNFLMQDQEIFGGKLKKPYVFLTVFESSGHLIGETSLVEQAMPLQDIVNICTRQIANNAIKMANGAWLVDSQVMTEEEATSKINNAPGIIIWGSGAANPSMMRRDVPPPMPQYVMELLQHSKNSMDTIFGTNSTTRGERTGAETKGGRVLLREADMSRANTFVRPVHRAVEELGNLILKYFMLFGTVAQDMTVLDADGTLRTVNQFNSEMARMVKEIRVIAADTLPKDPINETNLIMDKFERGVIDQLTALEKLKEANPRQTVERTLALKQGVLPPTPEMGLTGMVPGSLPPGVMPPPIPAQPGPSV